MCVCLCVCVCLCGGRFKIDQFDTGISFPDDPRKEPRDKELELMRDIYQYGQTAPDLPVQVCERRLKSAEIPQYLCFSLIPDKISGNIRFMQIFTGVPWR